MSKWFDAVFCGDLGEVARFVAKGADLNAVDEYGNAPLHVAAEAGHAAVVEFLIAHGADMSAADSYGGTPLHLAAIDGHAAVVEYLIAKGADVNAKAEDGNTALHMATRNGHAAIVEFLRQAQVTQPKANDRRDAVLALLAEDGGLRQRLGIKAGLEVAPDFDVERLLKFAVAKREPTDPTLGHDVEASIKFHLAAAKMLENETEHGNPMRPWRR